MTNVVAVLNDEILISTRLVKPNGTYYNEPLSGLYTKFGFIAPIEAHPLNLLNFLEHGHDDFEGWSETQMLGVLLTPSGSLWEFYHNYHGDNQVRRRRVGHGDGAMWVRSNRLPIEEVMSTALFIKRDLQRAIELAEQTHTGPKVLGTHVFKIQSIIDELHRLGFTEDQPFPKGLPKTNQLVSTSTDPDA